MIVIDAGGTSTKGYVINNSIKEVNEGPGNVFNNFNEAVSNIKNILGLYKDQEAYLFVAGYWSLNQEMKETFIKEFKGYKVKKIESDAFMPLHVTHEIKKTIITIGTGTTILVDDAKDIKIYYGHGHLIGDPLSGYDLAQKLIQQLLNFSPSVVFEYFKVKSKAEFIKFVYNNISNKNKIASFFGHYINNNGQNEIVKRILKSAYENLMEPNIKEEIKKTKEIILSGTVANQSWFEDFLKNDFPDKKILKFSSNLELVKEVAKKLEEENHE